MLLGILVGFVAAIGQSTSYVGSRIFEHKFPGRTLNLLSLAHLWMGLFSFVLFPFVWPASGMPSFFEYAPAMLACCGFYLIGQVCLFISLKTASASRVSPLLGIKVFILAIIGILCLGQHFHHLQWLAIFLSVIAAVMLSRTGESLSLKAIFFIALTCIGYSLSDIYIRILLSHFEYLGLIHACFLSVCLAYITSGIIGAVLFSIAPKPEKAMWKYSLPFAASWFSAMLFLFVCFASIGVVYGNIVQSSRGIISIIFGAMLVRLNFEHLDQRVSRAVFFQRLAAAFLMSCAIALYYLGA